MLYRLGGSAYRTARHPQPSRPLFVLLLHPSLVFADKQRRRPHDCGGSSRPVPGADVAGVSPLSACWAQIFQMCKSDSAMAADAQAQMQLEDEVRIA
jgi:hypothetical protein